MKAEDFALAVGRLGALQFFPKDQAARISIMETLERMVSTKAELVWLVRTMMDKVGRWYGPAELRGVFCTKFTPKDGVQAYCVETPQFTASDLERQYKDREEQERELKLLEWRQQAQIENKEPFPLPEVKRLQ